MSEKDESVQVKSDVSVYSQAIINTIKPILSEYEIRMKALFDSQSKISDQIDVLIIELQDCAKSAQFVDISKGIEKLNAMKRDAGVIATTLSGVSDRMNRLILLARRRYPELSELQKKRLRKETMDGIQKSLVEQQMDGRTSRGVSKGENQSVVEVVDDLKTEKTDQIVEKIETVIETPVKNEIEENVENPEVVEEDNTVVVTKVAKLLKSGRYTQDDLVNDDSMKLIIPHLPHHYQLHDWNLIYDSKLDGSSLVSFYFKTEDQGPTILLVRTEDGETFGGFASESWVKSPKYYGTGETFLFSMEPFKVAKWTKKNNYFMFSRDDSIAFGGGGHFSLWLDNDFSYGSAQESTTFDGAVSKEEDFKIYAVQVWNFAK